MTREGLRIGVAAVAIAAACALPHQVAAQSRAADGGSTDDVVVVTSSIMPVPQRQLATAVSVISGDEIEVRGLSSLADVMRTQPAIGVTNNGGIGKVTTLRIRGEDGYRTLLLIDGVKVSDASAPQAGPSFDSLLATSDLERIEVLRGPQGFVYGADAGGVVNLLTRIGTGPLGGRVALEAGSLGTQQVEASVSGGSELADYFVSLTDFETDGFNSRLSDTALADDDGADNTTVHAKFGWRPSDNLRVQLVTRDVDAAARFDGCGFPTIHDCESTTGQTTFRLSAAHDAGRFGNRFGFSEAAIDRDNITAGASVFATESTVGRLEYTGSFRPNDRTMLIYGFDLQREDIVAGGLPDERDQDGYYVEYQGDFDDRLFVSIGARYDDNEDFGSATSTRASAAWVQELGGGRSLKYRASYGTGFRAPSLQEIAYNNGPFAFPPAAGVGLVEETSEGHDLGIEYDTGNGLHLELTWFDQTIDDVIEFDLVGFSGYLQEPGTSSSDGFEFAARIPVGDRLEVLANWTENDTANAAGELRPRRPGSLANFAVGYRSSDETVRLIANYRLSKDAVDEVFGAGFVPLGDYEVLDISASWLLSEKIEIYGRLENALDEEYTEITDFRSAGRAAYAGLRLRL